MLVDTIISYICDMPYSETGAGVEDFSNISAPFILKKAFCKRLH
jgi:hypothetical protein